VKSLRDSDLDGEGELAEKVLQAVRKGLRLTGRVGKIWSVPREEEIILGRRLSRGIWGLGKNKKPSPSRTKKKVL